MKKCQETIFLKYLTKPNSTQVLAISARSEQYALFLTPIISTKIDILILKKEF